MLAWLIGLGLRFGLGLVVDDPTSAWLGLAEGRAFIRLGLADTCLLAYFGFGLFGSVYHDLFGILSN